MKNVFIYSAKRTPIGSFQGALSSIPAPKLGAAAAGAALGASGISGEKIDECVMGCVLSAGVGQAPARQVSVFSGLPKSVRALTVNKVCGSGLKAASLAADRIALGHAGGVLAGGMENMSQVPYFLMKAREGLRMGNQELIDGMIHDGLWDVYHSFHMGNAAELCAREFKFSRESQDQFAMESYRRAIEATKSSLFSEEIVPVEVQQKKETLKVSQDEEPFKAKLDKIAGLRPAFQKDGSITAANASSINDGAAAMVMGPEGFGGKPLARWIHCVEYAAEPEWFTTAPVGAIKKLLSEAQLKVSDVDVFEVNEAFAVVAMAAQKELEISAGKLNPRGGAVALGHPIGASGARLLVTLIHQLRPGQKGVVSLCIGGGEAIAALVERV